MRKNLTISVFTLFMLLGARCIAEAAANSGAPAAETNAVAAPANTGTNRLANNNSGTVDAENREFKAGDVFRYWVQEDPNNKSSEATQVRVTSAGTMLCPVSAGFQNYVTIDCSHKKLADIRAEIKRMLEEKYYYQATIHLDLDVILKGPDALSAGGSAVVFGEMSGKIPLPENQKVFLSQALAALHPSEYSDLARVQLNRKGAKVRVINVQKILDKNERDSDVELQDGDMIKVPAVGWRF